MLEFNIGAVSTANPDELYDLIIIGGGPAGLTAGLYAARYKRKTLMIEKKIVTGGQLTATEWVENYPGFPQPVLGARLAADMEAQAKLFGLQIVNDTVTEVELEEKIKKVHTPYAVWRAKAVLIATGTSARTLGVPGETEYYGKGVSYCATCDGPFYPDKTLAVVGGGNSAFEESLFLAKYASRIYLLHRSDQFRADKILIDRVVANSRIVLMPFYQVASIEFKESDAKHLLITDVRTNEVSRLTVDGLFIFIGNIPNTAVFEGKVEMDKGFVLADHTHQTSVNGVWAAGDVQVKALRQVATAVGDGANAAYWIDKYLEEWD